MTPSFELMAPLMFAGLIIVLLIGYPVAFSLSAVGLGFGFLAIELGYFDFVLLQALPETDLGHRLEPALAVDPVLYVHGRNTGALRTGRGSARHHGAAVRADPRRACLFGHP